MLEEHYKVLDILPYEFGTMVVLDVNEGCTEYGLGLNKINGKWWLWDDRMFQYMEIPDLDIPFEEVKICVENKSNNYTITTPIFDREYKECIAEYFQNTGLITEEMYDSYQISDPLNKILFVNIHDEEAAHALLTSLNGNNIKSDEELLNCYLWIKYSCPYYLQNIKVITRLKCEEVYKQFNKTDDEQEICTVTD